MADKDVPPPEFFEGACDDPGSIALDPLVVSLRADDGAVRRTAAEALYDVASTEPARVAESEAVSALVAALDDENPLVRERAAMALASVAEECDALAPVADSLADHLDDEYDVVTDYLAYALQCIAARTPETVVDVVPELCPVLSAEMKSTRYHVISTLVAVTDSDPDAVRPAIEPLLDVVDSRDSATEARSQPESSGAEVPGTAPAEPDDAEFQAGREPVLDGIADDLTPRTVEAALIVLAKLAAERPADAATRLHQHVPRLRPLLDDPDAGIRAVTAGILAAVAEYEPRAVEPATAQLADLLTDEVPTAAGNAAWALRYVETPAAKEALRDADLADSDVRAVVHAALDDLQAGNA